MKNIESIVFQFYFIKLRLKNQYLKPVLDLWTHRFMPEFMGKKEEKEKWTEKYNFCNEKKDKVIKL